MSQLVKVNANKKKQKKKEIPTSVTVDVVSPFVGVVSRLWLIVLLVSLLDDFVLDCNFIETST